MSHAQPLSEIWWLVSRASAIVALTLISLSVGLGLTMAAKVVRRPKLKRGIAGLHEHVALTALGAIAVHGLSLLGDKWLHPGVRGIIVPFSMGYRPLFTGLGIIAGYLAVLLGPSFYLRRRIGARRWRKLHRATVIVWLLSVVHALGAGTDGAKLWLRAVALAPLAPIVYLLVVRMLGGKRSPAQSSARSQGPERAARRTRSDASEKHTEVAGVFHAIDEAPATAA